MTGTVTRIAEEGLARSPTRRAALNSAQRLVAAVVAAGLLALLAVAAWLTPAQQGHGTHEQLGMYRCGWVVAFNKPCPTCGMTTAFAHAAEGDLWASFVTQPMGALLALTSSVGFWAALHAAVTGSHIGRICATMVRPWPLTVAAGLLIGAWVYKLLTWG